MIEKTSIDFPGPCMTSCLARCECIDGYKRDASDKCVPASECDMCPPGELWTECGSSCQEQFCPCPPGVFCDMPVCPEVCEERCQCPEGSHRDENDQCVDCDSTDWLLTYDCPLLTEI